MASNSKNSGKLPFANGDITAKEVRLIDENDKMVGVVSISDAQKRAKSAGLDLVEIVPNAEPPVCKILDFGKYKFQLRRRKNEMKKNQKVVHIKEIKLRPNIEEHDYGVKLRNINKFIQSGDKVKITLRFRGREIAHKEIGLALYDRIIEDTKEYAKVELAPKLDGKQILMVLVPKT